MEVVYPAAAGQLHPWHEALTQTLGKASEDSRIPPGESPSQAEMTRPENNHIAPTPTSVGAEREEWKGEDTSESGPGDNVNTFPPSSTKPSFRGLSYIDDSPQECTGEACCTRGCRPEL